jgi:hypothetical protein
VASVATSEQSVVSALDSAVETPSAQTPRFGFDDRLTGLKYPVAGG